LEMPRICALTPRLFDLRDAYGDNGTGAASRSDGTRVSHRSRSRWGDCMDIKVAEALSLLMMRINSQLNDSVVLVRDKCCAEDLQWYRPEVGKLMGASCLDIQEKLWAEHPSLRLPAKWTGLCG
jgi:hypothetical protein